MEEMFKLQFVHLAVTFMLYIRKIFSPSDTPEYFLIFNTCFVGYWPTSSIKLKIRNISLSIL